MVNKILPSEGERLVPSSGVPTDRRHPPHQMVVNGLPLWRWCNIRQGNDAYHPPNATRGLIPASGILYGCGMPSH